MLKAYFVRNILFEIDNCIPNIFSSRPIPIWEFLVQNYFDLIKFKRIVFYNQYVHI